MHFTTIGLIVELQPYNRDNCGPWMHTVQLVPVDVSL